jgi:hypothetical protein
MTSASASRLLEHAMRRISLKEITDFCPGDPGYPDYVQAFAKILSQRQLPPDWSFEITETIMLSGGDVPEQWDSARFRRFRIFINTVGVAMGITSKRGPNDIVPANYLFIQLLEDAYELRDAELLGLLVPVIPEYLDRIRDDGWFDDEAPLLLLAQLMLALLGYYPGSDIEKMAQDVIDSALRQPPNRDFLWACTIFNQRHDRWRFFVNLTFEPHRSNAVISSLRDALL